MEDIQTGSDATIENRVEQTIQLASSYFANNQVNRKDIPNVISTFALAVEALYTPRQTAGTVVLENQSVTNDPQEPAVPIDQSIHDDYLVCLNDGKHFKSLKRHLNTTYNLTPEAYRAMWGLDADYPMVAPAYSRARSELAKSMGLGQGSTGRRGGRKAKETPATDAPEVKADTNSDENEFGADEINEKWRDSLTDEGIRSFIDNKVYKSLDKHLKVSGVTPDEYRAKYGLPENYPTSAAEFAAFDKNA